MSDFDDIDLERTPEPPAAEPARLDYGEPRPPILPWVVGACLVAALVGAYFFLSRRGAPPASPTAVAETEVAAGGADKPLGGQPHEVAVPPLDESDPVVRELVGVLSSHPRIAALLATDGLIRRFVVVVENVASGTTPASHVRPLAPDGAFRVLERGSRLSVDPRSYARYNAIADAFASLDAAGSARVYATLKPRIEEAYRELGTGDGSFDRVLERAIRRLLETPVPPGDVPLVPSGIGYAFADPDLEDLSDAQKQLLRTGPRNARAIQDKLREIARALGMGTVPIS